MKLRTKLFQLGLGVVVPPLLLSMVLGVLLVRYEQDAFRDGALDRNRAFMSAVDAEIRGHMSALRLLSTSRSLEDNDLREFYAAAQRALISQTDWQAINLTLPTGKQVLNTRLPFGSELPSTAEVASVAHAATTGLPTVGAITMGPMSHTPGVPIRVPCFRNGVVVYILSAIVQPTAFEKLLHAQALPANYISGLIDVTGHFIARVPPLPAAATASPAFLGALKAGREGWYRGLTVEGKDTFTAFKTSDFTHWSVGLGIPSSEVNAAAESAAWLAGIGALLTFALAFSYAYWMGRRISAPIAALAGSARSIGRDNVPASIAADPEFLEVGDVAYALNEASVAIRERQQFIEREQANLRAADRAKDEFLAMLGHELRNPLSAVSNAAVLLNRGDLSLESRGAAQAIILRQTEQLTHLVNDLLDVGRVVAGKIRLEQLPLDLCQVAHDAVAAIKATGRADAHALTVHCRDAIFVQGDRTRLDQVITNLVSNAINFAREQSQIDVFVSKEHGFANIRVADTGVGLERTDLDSIFELFYQADKGLHRKGGLGIGLTLVKRIVELHGGTVSASSPGPGKGATFTVKLPALPDLPVTAKKTSPLENNMPKPARILIVDDSEDARESMALLLRSEGHEVNLAEDGQSGLDAALSQTPDVALVDIGMPGMDGYQVAQEIRKRIRQPISLVAMTGYGQAEDVRRAMEAGFDAHMVKPAEFAALIELLAKFANLADRRQGDPRKPEQAGPL